jgi:hypothetical protein
MTNEMKTISIKGKEYVQVNERIKAFRNNFKDYSLISEIIEMSDTHCVMKASVIDPQGRVVATGYARETVSKSPINKFAFVENAETSAWGRALGNFGIGVDVAICSAEELLQKINYSDSKIELPLEPDMQGQIDSCQNDVELAAVCQKISKELGEKEPQYRKSLVAAYKARLAEVK